MAEVGYADVLEWFESGECELDQLRGIKQAVDTRLGIPDVPYYKTDDPKVFEIGEEEIELIVRGKAQKEQLAGFRDWLQNWVSPAFGNISGEKMQRWQQGAVSLPDAIDMLVNLLDIDGIQRLGEIVIRKDEEFVEENFDIGWIIDGLSVILNRQPGLRRIAQGFFGARG